MRGVRMARAVVSPGPVRQVSITDHILEENY